VSGQWSGRFLAALAAAALAASACKAPDRTAGGGPGASASAQAPPPPLDTSWQSDPGRLLAAGDRAPPFEGIGHTGMRVRLASLLDAAVVVYFYGGDTSAEATTLAEGFRNSWLVLHGRASMVLGVSPDDRVTHRDFATREQLPFLLVADEDRKIARAFGVPAQGAPRIAAFVVGKDGKIVRAFSDPDPATLATQVIEALGGT
jgi:peroxiredoxin Q/BCP